MSLPRLLKNVLVLILFLLFSSAASSQSYTLSITINGNGTVSKSPDLTSYSNGSTVSLSATPATGQQFTGWSGDASGTANPLSITMNANKTITANFAAVKSLYFTKTSQTTEVEQGSSQTLSDYIATSDNKVITAKLFATDGFGNVPTWLSVNNKILNGINYTTGSEISFVFDATNLSIGTYNAVVTASAGGYANATLNILLTVKALSKGTLSNFKVNFQDSATKPPTGWLRDFGQSFGTRTSVYQANGFTYGWLKKSDRTPVDLTKNGIKRKSPADILLATFMHMQGNDVARFKGLLLKAFGKHKL